MLALIGIGMVLVWSATLHRDDLTGGDTAAYLRKQGVNAAIGLVLAAVVAATDHRWLRVWAPVVYLVSIVGLGLVFVPGVGATINGSHSWLLVGGLSLQPAELAKFGVVLGMALVLAERTEAHLRQGVNAVDVLPALLIAAVPAVLILAQPDLGTLMVLTATVFGVIGLSGAPKRWLVVLLAGGAVVVVGAVQTGLLESYQLLRFEAFTDPSLDPQGAGYNTIQARIAIGNGGITGQGLFDGTQTQSGFVPEQHTDFVFTVAGEELGLVGAAVVVGAVRAAAVAGAADRAARRGPVRPGRRRGRRLLVRFPGVPEHRHVPGDHAGHRCAAAAGVVRRHLDVRLAHRRRPAAERAPAHPAPRRSRRRGALPPRPLPLLSGREFSQGGLRKRRSTALQR